MVVDPVRLLASGQWVAEPKFDGIRAWMTVGKDAQIVNRNGEDITWRFPEIAEARNQQPIRDVLDGEVVAEDGSFETVLLRAKQSDPLTAKRMSITHPCRFVVFDLPRNEEVYLNRHRLIQRAEWPEPFATTPASDMAEFIEIAADLRMEGVILKRKQSYYQAGKRSKDWIKVKFTHRVTCVATTYHPGAGQRARFGAMDLQMVTQAGDLQHVGRVGSGFTEHELHELAHAIDSGERPLVEIECLGVTSGGKLRMPTFRGVRTDVDITNCGVDQLATLPTS